MPFRIDAENDAAELRVPASLKVPAHHFDGLANHLLIPMADGPVENEPHGFDSVAGHDEGTFRRGQFR